MAYDFPSTPDVGQVYNGYTYDGEKWALTASAPNQGGVISIQVFTASGTYTPSPNMTTCVIECQGAGGGGGGMAGGVATTVRVASGGGSGGYSRKTATAAQIGASQTVTIGQGGNGGPPGSGSSGFGVAGTDTSVGTLCIAKGGSPGIGGSGGFGQGGLAAPAGTGDLALPGQTAGPAMGFTTVGTASPIAAGGQGACSMFGNPGAGGGGVLNGTTAGGNAGGYGAGGGGAVASMSAATASGGDGSNGIVVITEYGITSLSSSASGAVRYDLPQTLTANQQAQARANIAVTKKNYIINGAMMVTQENGATAGLASTNYYPVDQFYASSGITTAVINVQRVYISPDKAIRLRLTVATADAAVGVDDRLRIEQKIEGYRVYDLAFGTASAKTVTLQFGVKAPAGTYSIVIGNEIPDRCYVAEYVIAAGEANTDVIKSVTIPGDQSGTWGNSINPGIVVRWGLMAGTNYQRAAGAWAGGNFIGSPNQFNFAGTVGNVFELFDVSLTEGTVAPPFVVPDYASELALCQRYYYKSTIHLMGYSLGSSADGQYFSHPVFMRATPTVVASGGTTLNNCSAPTAASATPEGLRAYVTVTATGTYALIGAVLTANARL